MRIGQVFSVLITLALLAVPALAQEDQGPPPRRGQGQGQGGPAGIPQEKRQQVHEIMQKYRQQHDALHKKMMAELKQVLSDEEFRRFAQHMPEGPGGRRPGQGGPNGQRSKDQSGPPNGQNGRPGDEDDE